MIRNNKNGKALVLEYKYNESMKHITLLYINSTSCDKKKLIVFANSFGRKYFGSQKPYYLVFGDKWKNSVIIRNAFMKGNSITLIDIKDEIYNAFCELFGKGYINTERYKDGKIKLHSEFKDKYKKPLNSLIKVTFSIKWI